MAQVATLSLPDKDELNQALKRQNEAIRTKVRQDHLDQRDNLL